MSTLSQAGQPLASWDVQPIISRSITRSNSTSKVCPAPHTLAPSSRPCLVHSAAIERVRIGDVVGVLPESPRADSDVENNDDAVDDDAVTRKHPRRDVEAVDPDECSPLAGSDDSDETQHDSTRQQPGRDRCSSVVSQKSTSMGSQCSTHKQPLNSFQSGRDARAPGGRETEIGNQERCELSIRDTRKNSVGRSPKPCGRSRFHAT